MTLRARLTLLLSTLLCIAFGLFGWLEVAELRRSALAEMDANLMLRAGELGLLWDTRRLEPGLLTPDPAASLIALQYFEVLDREGRSVFRSQELVDRGWHMPVAGPVFGKVRLPGGDPARIHRHIRAKDTLIIGESLKPLELTLEAAALRTAGLGLVMAVTALLVCYALLGRALAPLQSLTVSSRSILDTGVLPSNLPRPQGAPEVTTLVDTINTLLQRVDEVVSSQRRMLEDTSHELRTPLAVLSNDLGLLGQPLDESTRLEVAKEASEELTRLIVLVQDLLLISWAEARPQIELEPLSLSHLAKLALERLRAKAENRKLSVVGEGLVLGDPNRILQILRNLVTNAVHATGQDGSITIWIDSEEEPSALDRERYLLVVIQDDGIGIPLAQQQQVFERFYRVDKARSRALGGTGLGLPLARALARAQDGDLWVRSEPGHGCSFVLALRRA